MLLGLSQVIKQVQRCSTATTTALFTVVMRIWTRRQIGLCGREIAQLALGVNEQPMRGARRSYFGAQGQGLRLVTEGAARVSHVTQKLVEPSMEAKCQTRQRLDSH